MMKAIKMSVVASRLLVPESSKAVKHYLDHEQYSMLKLQKGKNNEK